MKHVASCILLLAFTMPAAEPIASGDWSEPVKGLRARLHLAEGAPVAGTRMALVYLEFENVSDVLNPMLVDFGSPQLNVVDSAGQSVPHSPAAASIISPPPYTVVLPHDSRLRFRISVSGYSISSNAGLAIQLDSGFWIIPADNTAERYIAGSFSVPELAPLDNQTRSKDIERGNRVWRGTLTLPKIKIPPLK